jgi:hypothetical protein
MCCTFKEIADKDDQDGDTSLPTFFVRPMIQENG